MVLNALYEHVNDPEAEDAYGPSASRLAERLGKDWNASKVGRALGRLGIRSSRGSKGVRFYDVFSDGENSGRYEDALRQYLPQSVKVEAEQTSLEG